MFSWMSEVGKIMIGVFHLPYRRSGDDAEIDCLLDIKDVGNIIMAL